MNRFSIVRVLVVGFAMLFLVAGVSYAQTSKGAISGTMSDKTGALVPSATVTATNTQLGEKRSATTDSEGSYRIQAINPGIYLVVVTASGFAELKITDVLVRASETTTVNGILEVSSVAATITVEAGTGQELQTQSGELSNSISRKEISQLPILGLNPIALVLTEPGVIAPSSREDFTNGVGFSVNGVRPRGNNFLLDGQANNDLSITGQAFQPQNLEAVAEVTILTNSYSAEFGKGGGSVTNVVYKGGTNDFHGSMWDLYQSTALQSIDASSLPPIDTFHNCTSSDVNRSNCKPESHENTYGFSFGGRAIKNKLFFFGTAQWDRFRSTASDSTLRVPTANGFATLQGLLPNPRVAALLLALGDLRGSSTITNIALGNGRPAVETGLVKPSGITQIFDAHEWSIRGDWLPTTNDTVGVRFLDSAEIFTPDTFANPGQLPGFRTAQGGPSKNLSTTWTHTFSGRAVNEFRFAYSLIDFSFFLLPATAANPASAGPTSTISGFLGPGAGVGVNGAFPQGRANQTWQFQDAASYTKGKHTFKIGFDLANYLATQSIPFNSRGSIGYVGGGACGTVAMPLTCTALANFVDDFTGSSGMVSKVFGSPIVHPDQTIMAYYGEDTWRVKPNFTLTLGVRYEYFGTPENVLAFPSVHPELGQFTDPFPTRVAQVRDTKDWAPRIGIAYTPRFARWLFGQEKTVIRAGYGMFYDGLFNNILVNTGASSPNVAGGTITAPSTGRGTANASGLIGSIAPGAFNPLLSVTSVVSDIRSPMTQQWNLNVQREIFWGMIVQGAYVGTRGERLFGNDELNYRVNGVRINPLRGAVTVRGNRRDSFYHAAQLKVERAFKRGLFFRAAYTFSRLIDDASEVFTTSGGSSRVQDFTNIEGDRGLSAFHRKHRAVFTYVWELPYVHSSDNAGLAVVKAITRDWQLSGTVSFQSGAPETVFIGGIDTNRDGNAFNGRPNLGNPGAAFDSIGIDGSFVGDVAGQLFDLNTGAPGPASSFHWLIQPGIGNVGRNTIITNGRQDWSFGILRTIKMPMKHLESQAIEFRTEMFNPFNHPNRGIPVLDLLNSDFANNVITRAGHREIRFWLKYKF